MFLFEVHAFVEWFHRSDCRVGRQLFRQRSRTAGGVFDAAVRNRPLLCERLSQARSQEFPKINVHISGS